MMLNNMKSLCSDILARHSVMSPQTLAEKYAELAEIVLSREIMELPYAVRNEPFLTSSKIKDFERCEFCYAKRYMEMATDRTVGEKDYFVIGQAVDDYLTLGESYFSQKYVVMDSRINDLDEAIEGQELKIVQAQADVKKDGERGATGIKTEAKAIERIAFLKTLTEKTQITATMYDLIISAITEYANTEMFNKQPRKRVFFHVFGGFLIKVELDDYVKETNVINDIKTTANALTACEMNFPEMYSHQAALYEWIVEENVFATPTVRLLAVDKNPHFSRSLGWEYLHDTLMPVRGRMIETIARMRTAHDTGYFPSPADQKLMYTCPYYGIEGHGRPTSFLIY